MTVWACARPKHSRSRTEAHREMDCVKFMVRYSDGDKLHELRNYSAVAETQTRFLRSQNKSR